MATNKETAYGKKFPFTEVMNTLETHAKSVDIPVITLMAMQGNDPYKILITTILSARTKDQTTIGAGRRLFERAKSLEQLSEMSEEEIAQLIKPVGFYITKAKNIKATATILLQEHKGIVPHDIDTLITLPGVGRKTANLVAAEAFKKPAICVDTHVHRISNRLGVIETDTVLATEQSLEKIVPKEQWTRWNPLIVAFGQSLCTPISPKCSQCPIYKQCKRIGVTSQR